MAKSPNTVPPTGQPGSSVATENPYLNALIWGDKWGSPWTAVPGSTTVVTYAFVNKLGMEGAATTWSGADKSAMRAALATWEAVADVRFVEVTSGSGADATYQQFGEHMVSLDVADLTFDKGPVSDFELEEEFLGFQIGPVGEAYAGFGGYNGADPTWTPAALAPGGYAFVTLVHELGHGLGLAHPHDDGGISGVFPGIDPAPPSERPSLEPGLHDLNQGVWTTMSYRDGLVTDSVRAFGVLDYGYQATPMAFDVAAIQYIYGANTGHATGDDVYTLPTVNAPGTAYACIWDAGGVDTVTYSGGDDCVIDLRAAPLQGPDAGGYLSKAGTVYGGFTIAAGAIIENATAGAGDDRLVGNGAANTLIGDAGTDILYGALDTDMLYGNTGADTLFGGQGDDALFGGQGNDVLYGNLGDDVLHGNVGSDRLVGGAGRDTLTGGEGADLFVLTTPDEGGDVITDFERGVDKIAVVSPNFGTLSYGPLDASNFALGSPADADDIFVFDTATGVLSFDADGSGEGVGMVLATLNVRTLSAADITVLAV